MDKGYELNRWLCVTALFMASLNLRPVVSSIAPVLGSIQHDLGLSGAVSSLLVSIPVLCMGILAPFSVKSSERLGIERVITLSLILIGGSSLLHVFIHSASWLVFTTLLSGIGIAMMGPLLSGFIKKHMADRAPSMIAIYSMALALGAALGSSLTSPLYGRFHSWQMSLSFWAIPVVLALPLWLNMLKQLPSRSKLSSTVSFGKSVERPWHKRKAWILSVQFGMLSIVFYSLLAWLPLILLGAGATKLHAGLMVTMFALIQVPSGIVVQQLLKKHRSRRNWLIISSMMQAAGLLLIFFSTYLWFAVFICGLGSGMLFALLNLLPVEMTSSSEEATSWAAMTQCIGFLIGASGPLLMGYLHDRMGHFNEGILVMVFISVAMGILSLTMGSKKET
ncbi:CynX/NimT family MFS transporter [Paenibacillus sp. 1781tsa1]|uniref:MFS transporter n=1 Tax=Paenibacillus sp. 1781tsa1 TaxID=2953810 RepID=UPI00209D7A29|nr:MFS transporter [Paenibacillus sp. 1781tsa1]MCP1184627.1 MFS transporter [Paenibacillus sp. 1781tsa1]